MEDNKLFLDILFKNFAKLINKTENFSHYLIHSMYPLVVIDYEYIPYIYNLAKILHRQSFNLSHIDAKYNPEFAFKRSTKLSSEQKLQNSS